MQVSYFAFWHGRQHQQTAPIRPGPGHIGAEQTETSLF